MRNHTYEEIGLTDLPEGWALRTTKKPNKDDESARELIRQYFKKKRDEKKKCNPYEAELHMKTMRQPGSGSLLFSPKNRLSISQIKSLINGLLKKKHEEVNEIVSSKKEENENVSDEDEEEEDTDDEAELSELIRDAYKKNGENDEDEEMEMTIDSDEEPLSKHRRTK